MTARSDVLPVFFHDAWVFIRYDLKYTSSGLFAISLLFPRCLIPVAMVLGSLPLLRHSPMFLPMTEVVFVSDNDGFFLFFIFERNYHNKPTIFESVSSNLNRTT